MSFGEIVSWAWDETPSVHRNATNLLIHAVAVPLFVSAHVLLVAGILIDYRLLLAGLVSIVVSLAMQRFGHSLERNPPIQFSGPVDFVRRIYAEQFCNFWRFLLSGQWYRSLKARDGNARAAGPRHSHPDE